MDLDNTTLAAVVALATSIVVGATLIAGRVNKGPKWVGQEGDFVRSRITNEEGVIDEVLDDEHVRVLWSNWYMQRMRKADLIIVKFRGAA